MSQALKTALLGSVSPNAMFADHRARAHLEELAEKLPPNAVRVRNIRLGAEIFQRRAERLRVTYYDESGPVTKEVWDDVKPDA